MFIRVYLRPIKIFFGCGYAALWFHFPHSKIWAFNHSKIVSGFAMLAKVQATFFFFIAHPQAHGPVQNFQQHKSHPKSVNPGGHNRQGLYSEESGVSEEKTIIPGIVDHFGSEEPGGQGPPGPANAVDPDHIEAVVVTEAILGDHAQVAKNARDEPDE